MLKISFICKKCKHNILLTDERVEQIKKSLNLKEGDSFELSLINNIDHFFCSECQSKSLLLVFDKHEDKNKAKSESFEKKEVNKSQRLDKKYKSKVDFNSTRKVICSECKKQIDQKEVDKDPLVRVCSNCVAAFNALKSSSPKKKHFFRSVPPVSNEKSLNPQGELFLVRNLCVRCNKEIEKERLQRVHGITLCLECTNKEVDEHNIYLNKMEEKIKNQKNKEVREQTSVYGRTKRYKRYN